MLGNKFKKNIRNRKILKIEEFLPHDSPVKILPIKIIVKLFPVAIRIHPTTQGNAANLIVFKRPSHSINTPAIRHPAGTANTIMEAK